MPSAVNSVTTIDATVTSKGQITLPSELRKRLGLQKGSRLRFSIPTTGPVLVEPVRYTIGDLWRMADTGPKLARIVSFEAMNAAKHRRR